VHDQCLAKRKVPVSQIGFDQAIVSANIQLDLEAVG